MSTLYDYFTSYKALKLSMSLSLSLRWDWTPSCWESQSHWSICHPPPLLSSHHHLSVLRGAYWAESLMSCDLLLQGWTKSFQLSQIIGIEKLIHICCSPSLPSSIKCCAIIINYISFNNKLIFPYICSS